VTARRRLRRIAARAVGSPPVSAVMGALDRARHDGDGRLAVLTFHRVAGAADRPDLAPSLRSCSGQGLATLVDLMAESWTIVGVEAVLDAVHSRRLPAARCLLLTFDDGYDDFATEAWPILRERGLPAILFIPTAYPDTGTPFWWDALHAAVRDASEGTILPSPGEPITVGADRHAATRAVRTALKETPPAEVPGWVAEIASVAGSSPARGSVLSWARLRSLADEGVTLAPHTRSHPILPLLDDEAIAAELRGSADDLAAHVGPVPPVLAYPSGAFDDRVVAIAREAGFAAAFTTARGVNRLRSLDPLRLRRINVGGGTGAHAVRNQVAWWAK
jgi:peptidoglycan/xylan/chitin deacetylase (PgdA/CDA1 family)